jgi:hypothetical protein
VSDLLSRSLFALLTSITRADSLTSHICVAHSSSAPPATPAPSAPPSSVPAAPNPRRTAGFNIAQTEGGGYTPEQLAQLQAMLEGQAGGAAEELGSSLPLLSSARKTWIGAERHLPLFVMIHFSVMYGNF